MNEQGNGVGTLDRRRGAVKPPDRGQRAPIGAMERGATPIGGASASREVEKEGKVLTQSPESHRTENHLPRGERRRGERVNRDGGRRSPQRRKIEKGEGLLANSELANGGGLSLEVKSKINK